VPASCGAQSVWYIGWRRTRVVNLLASGGLALIIYDEQLCLPGPDLAGGRPGAQWRRW